MFHIITNELLTCSIIAKGAEIRSLKNNKTGQEYIWQIDPDVWRSSSPPLFPAIGTIKGDKIIYKDKEYPMPKHGIARDNDNFEFPTNYDISLLIIDDLKELYPDVWALISNFQDAAMKGLVRYYEEGMASGNFIKANPKLL